MKYTAEIGLAAMVYVPSLIKIVSDIQKLLIGHTQTYRED
jgi:hypothetical protein